jgi:hypothetical protein
LAAWPGSLAWHLLIYHARPYALLSWFLLGVGVGAIAGAIWRGRDWRQARRATRVEKIIAAMSSDERHAFALGGTLDLDTIEARAARVTLLKVAMDEAEERRATGH